jgi:predicted ester cyclase
MSVEGITPAAIRAEIEAVVREHFRIVADGELAAMDDNVTADFVNIRSAEEPLTARQPGPDGLRATSVWLRQTFAELRFEIHDIVIHDDRVAALVTMRGRQHGTFLVYDDECGKITDAFPSTGSTLAVRQTHWFRIRDGKISEHDAVRDDLGMAKQLEWLPPTPMYLVRMRLALRRERQRQRHPA